jgi:hypothetical protein
MIISIRKMMRYLQMGMYILLFSFVLFKIFSLLHTMVQPSDPYREPRQDAVKVNASNPQGTSSWWRSCLERLREFYLIGE